jgi:hypothetical protein
MNQFQTCRQEAVRLAQLILNTIEGPLRVDYRKDPESMARAEAIKGILRSNAKGEFPSRYHVELLQRCLCISVDSLRIESHKTDYGTVHYLSPAVDMLRKLAELTIDFTDLFLKTPALLKTHPLGICARHECGELFVRVKPRKKFCSDACREQSWRKAKVDSAPGYYSKKAQEARQAKKMQKKASIRSKTQRHKG